MKGNFSEILLQILLFSKILQKKIKHPVQSLAERINREKTQRKTVSSETTETESRCAITD